MTRLAAVPSIWGSDMRSWLDTAEGALQTGKVSAVFAPDHLRTRDREGPHTLSWPVLLAAVQQAYGVTVGPLVARCGVGSDEHVFHALSSLADSGEVVANLGIGDRVGRGELARAGLPWPERDVRIGRLAETSQRFLDAGFEVFVASDRDDLHARMPQGAGAHISRERSENDHGATFGRTVAVAYWSDTSEKDLLHLPAGQYSWVCLEQLPEEPPEYFFSRVRTAAGVLGL